MRRRVAIIAAGLVAAAAGITALPNASASELCYDVQVNVNGTPVGQTGCQDIPDLPALP